MTRSLLLLIVALVVALIASLHLGLRLYGPGEVLAALADHGEGTDAVIIRSLRLPRTLIAVVAGAAFALSGLMIQIVTRNPLAEPGLIGINAGAGLAVALGISVFGGIGLPQIGLLAFTGALAATGLVFGVTATSGGATRNDTTLLAGVTIAALLSSMTQVILLLDETALETLLFWLSGGFADRDLGLLGIGLPALILGYAACAALAQSLDALRLNDQTAEALGVSVSRVRAASLVTAAGLAAGAVAMSGPIIFLGLIAPHLARRLIGDAAPTLRLALFTCLIGGLIAVLADIAARLIVAPGEAPVGSVLALVGVPILIGLLRRKRTLAR
ncbi:FecCD family ABC transporter permease [Paracoccus alkanivorans]|uniref:Iron ABC transporter permease n=1 Tax=Paracoccus alkanivorans TaxID=2116655 RepID=A0A3M0N2G8_9RHOB|nr:iron ABC transporter permease [Paracoccus alkanivorans]RMC37937.1 iron ABC transporter permease [Paracoccus alkanivorans]